MRARKVAAARSRRAAPGRRFICYIFDYSIYIYLYYFIYILLLYIFIFLTTCFIAIYRILLYMLLLYFFCYIHTL